MSDPHAWPPLSSEELAARIRDLIPTAVSELAELVQIPSVSSDPRHTADLRRSAAAIEEIYRPLGFNTRVVTYQGRPSVLGERPGEPGASTVLLYAHHDVQPIGDLAAWSSDPFGQVRRGRRLFGRGVADDKAAIVSHAVALRALGDGCRAGLRLLVEGDEELGSPGLTELLADHGTDLDADVALIPDAMNESTQQPTFTTSLRGILGLAVTVETLREPRHSGLYGGAAPDALSVLIRMLATLHTAEGDVAVRGLDSTPSQLAGPEPGRFRDEAGVLPGVSLSGTGTLADRLWSRPAITVTGIDAPAVAEAANILLPRARAKISVRLPPGTTPETARAAVEEHLQAHLELGAAIGIEVLESAPGYLAAPDDVRLETAGDCFRAAWGSREPVARVGLGGAIPIVGALESRFPQMSLAVCALQDPDSNAHGIDESLDLEVFERLCLAEALLLQHASRLT